MNKVIKQREDDKLCIGTHDGIFHCDEVVAIAILSLIRGNLNVIRSRDKNVLAQANLLVDVGFGKYDHHQEGGNGVRANGVKYASAGLIWRDFGADAVSLLADGTLSKEEAMIVANTIDEEIIQSVDMEDNGDAVTNHIFQFIPSFIPNRYENTDTDTAFEECINLVVPLLKRSIKKYIALYLDKSEIFSRINNPKTHIENVLEIPDQNMQWKEELIRHNENSNNKIDFVIFDYHGSGYALQCVPPSLEKIMEQRIPLPEEWAGKRDDDLQKISGIPTATFCHNKRFFGRAETRDGVIAMCETATKEKSIKDTRSEYAMERRAY